LFRSSVTLTWNEAQSEIYKISQKKKKISRGVRWEGQRKSHVSKTNDCSTLHFQTSIVNYMEADLLHTRGKILKYLAILRLMTRCVKTSYSVFPHQAKCDVLMQWRRRNEGRRNLKPSQNYTWNAVTNQFLQLGVCQLMVHLIPEPHD